MHRRHCVGCEFGFVFTTPVLLQAKTQHSSTSRVITALIASFMFFFKIDLGTTFPFISLTGAEALPWLNYHITTNKKLHKQRGQDKLNNMHIIPCTGSRGHANTSISHLHTRQSYRRRCKEQHHNECLSDIIF